LNGDLIGINWVKNLVKFGHTFLGKNVLSNSIVLQQNIGVDAVQLINFTTKIS
jgi:hypothetical protein